MAQNSGVTFSLLFSIYALILTRSRLGLFQVCIIFLTFVSVMAQYLEIKWIEFHQILLTRSRLRFLPVIICLFVTESWPLMDVSNSFLHINQQNLTKFCLCIDIDRI